MPYMHHTPAFPVPHAVPAVLFLRYSARRAPAVPFMVYSASLASLRAPPHVFRGTFTEPAYARLGKGHWHPSDGLSARVGVDL